MLYFLFHDAQILRRACGINPLVSYLWEEPFNHSPNTIKKRLAIFPSLAGMSLTKFSLTFLQCSLALSLE
jgi:hypothetical protein